MKDNSMASELDEYEILSTLGSGLTGKVKLAKRKGTDQKFAIKVIKRNFFDSEPEFYSRIKREISMMKLLEHSHIIKLINIYESSKHLYIVLEFAENGQLGKMINEDNYLELNKAFKIFRQIIYGIEFLHDNCICHRDIKPENILIDTYGDVKLADFGFAKLLKDNITSTKCGSLHYTAPEVLVSSSYDGRTSDIWSCGVILYAMLCGKLPFDETSVKKLFLKIKRGSFVMPNFATEIQDLIYRMLKVDPQERITISQIKEHPALRIGVPSLYVFPKPLTYLQKVTPLSIESLTDETRTIFKNLGLDDENHIKSELESEEFTVCKKFYMMLNQKLSFDFINWDVNVDENETPISCMVSSGDAIPVEFISSRKSSYSASYSLSQPSFSFYGNGLFDGDPYNHLHRSDTLKVSDIALENLASSIQNALSQNGHKYVYPDDMTFLVRTLENEDYVVHLTKKGNDVINVDVLAVSVDTRLFSEFFELISKAALDAPA